MVLATVNALEALAPAGLLVGAVVLGMAVVVYRQGLGPFEPVRARFANSPSSDSDRGAAGVAGDTEGDADSVREGDSAEDHASGGWVLVEDEPENRGHSIGSRSVATENPSAQKPETQARSVPPERRRDEGHP